MPRRGAGSGSVGANGEFVPDNPIMAALAEGPLDMPSAGTLGEAMTQGMGADPGLPNLPQFKARHGMTGRDALALFAGVLGDGLSAYGGRPGVFAPAMMAEREGEREDNRFAERLRLTNEEARRKALEPRMEQVGNTVGWLDPSTHSFQSVFTAPGAGGQYALDRGLEPGSPEYQQAVGDYRLGSWSDPAMDNRLEMEGVRFGNRSALQDDRLAVTRRGQDIRSGDTRRGQNVSASNSARTAATTMRGQDIRLA
jgi:hypothetical protein